MKMPAEPIESIMFAPCGMNCMICYKHCASKSPCPGCLRSGTEKPEHCRKCKIKACIRGKGYSYCYDCTGYPCKQIKNLERNYNARYGISLMRNNQIVKEKGMAEFMEQQKERYTCPECGGIIPLHNSECSECQRHIL